MHTVMRGVLAEALKIHFPTVKPAGRVFALELAMRSPDAFGEHVAEFPQKQVDAFWMDLAKSLYPDVQLFVAKNRAATAEALTHLATAGSETAQLAVVNNEATGAFQLMRMIGSNTNVARVVHKRLALMYNDQNEAATC